MDKSIGKKEEAYVKSIGIGKKDGVISKWRSVVQEKEDRMVSYLVKQALLAFVQKGVFIEIGRIHYNPQYDHIEKKPITLWLQDSPELIQWSEALKEKNIPVTKAFKKVLLNCIKVIPENEEEYIPDYYDFMKTDDMLDLIKSTIDVPEPSASITNVTPKPITNNNTPKPIHNEIKADSQKQDITNKEPISKPISIKPTTNESNVNKPRAIDILGLGVRR